MDTPNTITITEALAEVQFIGKKVAQKAANIQGMAILPGDKKDPLQAEGGSAEVVKREQQAIEDLMNRLVKIRTNIQVANQTNIVEVAGVKKSVAEWLNWRREVLPIAQSNNQRLLAVIENYRAGRRNTANTPEAIINVDETALRKQVEWLLEAQAQLDGKLSLFNATTTIEA